MTQVQDVYKALQALIRPAGKILDAYNDEEDIFQGDVNDLSAAVDEAKTILRDLGIDPEE